MHFIIIFLLLLLLINMEKEQSLEYWCDMMVKTYNTSILDNFPTSLKESLQEEAQQCVESKPNPNSYNQLFGRVKRKKIEMC